MESAHLVEEIQNQNAGLPVENALVSSGEMVLMQTAQCTIRNPINGLNETARMLLDSERQRTYITETLA